MPIENNICPLCSENAKRDIRQDDADTFQVDCHLCGRYAITDDFVRFAQQKHPHLELHLLSAYVRERSDLAELVTVSLSNCQAFEATAPRRIPEKANKILAAIERRTQYFGFEVEIKSDTEFPLGYAVNEAEFLKLLDYLEKKCLVFRGRTSNQLSRRVSLTADGFDAVQRQTLLTPLIVFLSSTCYDLLDLRSELADALERNGMIVKMSEDSDRFEVGGTTDSIETCLQNVDQSDVVVCIIDRRYGGIIKDGERQGYSGTHLEIQRANECNKPIFFFIRDRAEVEYHQLRSNAEYSPKWVESEPVKKRKWLELAQQAFDLSDGQPNWMNQFQTVVDLKRLVAKRLTDLQNMCNRRD